MSSYLQIRIMNKNKYSEYLNKYEEFEKQEKSFLDEEWSCVYKIIKDNSFVLVWSSRSFRLYQTIQKSMGYSWKTSIITAEGLRSALKILKEDYNIYKEELDYYKKNGFFKSQITSKRIENAIKYLDSIRSICNEEKIDNIKTILSKTNNYEIDDSLYKECEEELDDIEYAKTIIEALIIFLDHINDDSVLVYDMD